MRLVALCFLCAAAIGCKKEEPAATEQRVEAAPAEPTMTEPAEAPPSEAAAENEPSAEEVPVAEDFTEEAETRIAAENYQAELDRIEREIEADVAAPHMQ
jgi:hypothetical protein